MMLIHLPKYLLPAIAGLLFCCQSVLAEGKFSEGLSMEDRIACGLTHITVSQQTILDALIQRDVDAARQGNVTAFAKTFIQRRSEKECAESGIASFTEVERTKLDAVVAAAIARKPMTQVYQETQSKPLVGIGMPKRKGEIHGSMSLMYGMGSGGSSAYGAAMDVNYTDPSGRLQVAVGYSEIHGKGWYSPYVRRGRGYAYDPFYTGYSPLLP